MRSPALSVVICTLGQEGVGATIGSALASIEAAETAAEVVVVWQGRATPAVPDGVRVVTTIPAGLSHARNVGIAVSTGATIGFIDDDELVAASWAAGVLQGVAEGADAVFGPVDPMDDLGRPYCELVGEEPRWIEPHERPWNVGTGGNMAASREVLARLGGFDPRMGIGSYGRSAEDSLLIAGLQRLGARLRWRPEMRVSHPSKTDAEMLASRYPYGFGAGRMIRQLRSVSLAVRYGVDLGWAAREVVRGRSRFRARELAATARGFTAGVARSDRWRAPDALLEGLPGELRSALLGHVPRGLLVPHRSDDPHFLYAVGEHRVLHVYGAPRPGQREALRAREALRVARLAGIPELHAAVETDTALWLVEDRIPGQAARPVRNPAWWGAITGVLVALGRVTGPTVRDGGWWREAREALPAALSPAWAEPLAAALEIAGDLPSVVAHGDVQPKNIVVDGARAGLVDWDGAVAEGPPGLDLLFLAVTARTGRPDTAPLIALAAGRDVSGVPLLGALRAVGPGRRDGLLARARRSGDVGRRGTSPRSAPARSRHPARARVRSAPGRGRPRARERSALADDLGVERLVGVRDGAPRVMDEHMLAPGSPEPRAQARVSQQAHDGIREAVARGSEEELLPVARAEPLRSQGRRDRRRPARHRLEQLVLDPRAALHRAREHRRASQERPQVGRVGHDLDARAGQRGDGRGGRASGEHQPRVRDRRAHARQHALRQRLGGLLVGGCLEDAGEQQGARVALDRRVGPEVLGIDAVRDDGRTQRGVARRLASASWALTSTTRRYGR